MRHNISPPVSTEGCEELKPSLPKSSVTSFDLHDLKELISLLQHQFVKTEKELIKNPRKFFLIVYAFYFFLYSNDFFCPTNPTTMSWLPHEIKKICKSLTIKMQNQKIKKITWMINNVARYIYSNSTLLTFTPLHLFDKSLVTLQTACCIIIISVLLVYQRLYKKKKHIFQ